MFYTETNLALAVNLSATYMQRTTWRKLSVMATTFPPLDLICWNKLLILSQFPQSSDKADKEKEEDIEIEWDEFINNGFDLRYTSLHE